MISEWTWRSVTSGQNSDRLVRRPAIRAHLSKKAARFRLTADLGIIFGKSQVECSSGRRRGDESAAAGRKAVNQPGNFAQVHGAKNRRSLDSDRFALLGGGRRKRTLLFCFETGFATPHVTRSGPVVLSSLPFAPAPANSGDKFIFILSHQLDQRLIPGVLMRGRPENHFGEHRSQVDSFLRKPVNHFASVPRVRTHGDNSVLHNFRKRSARMLVAMPS